MGGIASRFSPTNFASIRHSQLVLSGIKPTGVLHLGNYFDAIRPWVKMQNILSSIPRNRPVHFLNYPIPTIPFYLGISDMHAFSLGPKKSDQSDKLRHDVFHTAASLIAAGIDPSTTVLFRMSTIPEIAELSRILCTPQPSYPMLQATSVLAFRATFLAKGSDQREHMNLIIKLIASANMSCGERIFQLPKDFGSPPYAVEQKMSNFSVRGRINLTDDSNAIADKCRKAQSDANLVRITIDLLAAVRETTPEEVVKAAKGWNIVQLKEALAVETNALIAPIRDRYETITKDPQEVYRILETNEEKARATVSDTMKIVLKAVGFR